MSVSVSVFVHEGEAPRVCPSHDGKHCWVYLNDEVSTAVHCDTPETADRISAAFRELADEMRQREHPRCPVCNAPEPCVDERCERERDPDPSLFETIP